MKIYITNVFVDDQEKALNFYTNIVFSIPVWQIFGAVLLALLIGAISGVYPAIKASKIQPAEAVRK